MFSPRERGWSQPAGLTHVRVLVLPARAGLVPTASAPSHPNGRSPRASGAGPQSHDVFKIVPSFSPPERGWSLGVRALRHAGHVLPARAGLARRYPIRRSPKFRSPRASGAGPDGWGNLKAAGLFSPARAGLVPGSCTGRPSAARSPRVSGAGPYLARSSGVFPARAGLVRVGETRAAPPSRSPRASGAGPLFRYRKETASWFSPRERGWSPGPLLGLLDLLVLPARAGLVRTPRHCADSRSRSPRASGAGPAL